MIERISDLRLGEMDVSRETFERLEIYAALIERWNPKINLVAKGTMDALWTRHFLDSAQLLEISPDGATWADMGSGGGFPGLVIAILAAEFRPAVTVTLVESDQRKAAFLRTAARETGVGVDVEAARIETVTPLRAGILSARALAPLSVLVEYTERHLSPNGRALFPKGKSAEREIEEALAYWRFDCERYPSVTDSDAVILSIGDLERV